MVPSRSFHVVLPPDIAEMVDNKVASGEYGSPADVICRGLETLRAEDAEVDAWLRTKVAATYDAHMSGSSRSLSVEDVLSNLDQRFASVTAR